MPIAFDSLPALLDHGFDTVIDVRSPAEFAKDHIPGAINLPALSNEERAIVGTIYTQVSHFDARKIGAAMVARNAAHAIETALKDFDGAWRPLVYCWRGGQRSGSFASILAQIGWRAETIAGGYRAYRRLVNAALYTSPLQHRLVLLDGNTGTAKTEILRLAAELGAQAVDLEGLAQHRGSMLGALPGGQPEQAAFETALVAALAGFDPARPVLVEAESSRIGRIVIPPSFWAAMTAAPRIELHSPVATRAAYLTEAYADVWADPERMERLFDPLRAHRSHAVVDGWVSLLRAGDMPALAAALVEQHYDPAYAKSRAVHDPVIAARIDVPILDHAGRAAAAAKVAGLLSRM